MRWYHEVSEEWMQARKHVLTATDVKNLVPELKRIKKRNDPDALSPGFVALWGEKNSDMLIDVSSTGAAARGHIMEPYAVDDWNKQRNDKFFHWDDCVICNGYIGFSPDAIDVQQPTGHVKLDWDGECLRDGDMVFPSPSRIMEIKSYEPAHHMKSVIEAKEDHQEKMQIAVAFYSLPCIESAVLLFYCPGAPISMHKVEYTRNDLAEELAIVEEIEKEYAKTVNAMNNFDKPTLNAFHTEREIWANNQEVVSKNGMFLLK